MQPREVDPILPILGLVLACLCKGFLGKVELAGGCVRNAQVGPGLPKVALDCERAQVHGNLLLVPGAISELHAEIVAQLVVVRVDAQACLVRLERLVLPPLAREQRAQ